MEQDEQGADRRRVQIRTEQGSIDGCVHVHSGVRTLDWLNLRQRFVPLEVTEIATEDLSFERGRLGINREHILYLVELSDLPRSTDARIEALHFSRQAVAVRVGDCDIRGYLHLRGVIDPLAHLSRIRDEFIALTSASIVGPDFEMVTNFLAFNPTHALGVQPLQGEGDEESVVSEGQAWATGIV